MWSVVGVVALTFDNPFNIGFNIVRYGLNSIFIRFYELRFNVEFKPFVGVFLSPTLRLANYALLGRRRRRPSGQVL